MALDNLIKLGDVWLTSDGSEAGLPCVVDVTGLPDLKMKWWGNAGRNARGNAVMNLSKVAGVDLTLSIPSVFITILDSIVDLFDEALDDDTTFELMIEGETGNYYLDAEPNPSNSVTWKETINGLATDVEIRVITRKVED